MTPPSPLDSLESLQTRKLQLEVEKLGQERDKLVAETRILRRRWFLQPSYIAAILPIIALSITGVVTYLNSDLKREADENRREVKAAREEKRKVDDSVAAARNELKQLEKTLAPRTLSQSQQRDMEANLKRFSGHSIKVLLTNEPEGVVYGESIISILKAAGWAVNTPAPFSRIERYGTLVGGPDPSSSALKTLVNELVKCGNPVLFTPMASGQSDVLEVYSKPPVGLPPRLMVPNFDEGLWQLPPNWMSTR